MSKPGHFVDELLDRVAAKGAPICVGIDPVIERLPGDDGTPTERIEQWVATLLEQIEPYAAVVKFQSACFERYGSAGVACLEACITRAKLAGLVVVLDAKRGDIGISAAHYAAGNLSGADALTINPYMGPDTMEPFIDHASEHGQGLFALVRTSNPGSDALQTLDLADGRRVVDAVADMVVGAGADHVGERGYSLLGAVVGATKTDEIAALRQRMPQQIFLVPGYGAQGGAAEDVKACFNPDGTGAIITASRSIIYAADPAAAAKQMRDEIAELIG